MASIGIGIGIENPKFPSIGIGIGIEKLILYLGIGIGIGIDLKKYLFYRLLSKISKINIKTPIVTTKLSKSAKTGLICPYMDDLKQL